MKSFSYDTLWDKSVVFISRGFEARHVRDYGLFALWAAIALELAGKAALAKIHPALVADPTHQESLFTACGHSLGSDRKTITAKTVYERLTRLSPAFDEQMRKFCLRMAHQRNAELHSGDLPLQGLSIDTWVSNFWGAAKEILAIQGKTLSDWVGEAEAKDAQEVIERAMTALEQAVRRRIARHRERFEQATPTDSQKREFLQTEARQRAERAVHSSNESWGIAVLDCPACKSAGELQGSYWDEGNGRLESLYDEEGEIQIELVDVTYTSEIFECQVCGLKLEGKREMTAAGIEDLFGGVVEREVEWEAEYGND